MGPISTTFINGLGSLLEKTLHQASMQQNHSLALLHSSFSLLRSLIMCLRAASSSSGRLQLAVSNMSLVVSELSKALSD